MGSGVSSRALSLYLEHETPVAEELPTQEMKYDEKLAHLKDWPNVEDCSKFSSSEKSLTSWNFDIWKTSRDDFPTLCSSIILHHALPTKFNIKYPKWCGLYRQVEFNMSTSMNPYHNFIHVVDVMQTCASFLGEMGASMVLNDTDILALYLSAFLHDIGHPGLNNVYQINAETALALCYNDISVLENHHCALAFAVFKQPNSNIFEEVSFSLRKTIRKAMIEMILSTDMMTHFTLTDELNDCVTRNFTPLDSIAAINAAVLNDKDRTTLLRSILHAADISNPAKVWETSKKWSDLVVQEFFAQGDLEKAQALPVSMNMDRCFAVQDEISLNFNDFIVAPFFFTLLKAFPKLEKPVRYLETNRYEWDSIMRCRITKSTTIEEAQKVEVLGKWTARESDFLSKLKAALDVADNKLANCGI
jgi:3'5'-cyclic nucleotide phosphodiesterase